MADAKVTALSENTSVASTDVLYLVDNPGGSPASQKATVANVVKGAQLARELISEQTPTSTGTVTFSTIPGTYRNLYLEWVGRSTNTDVFDDMTLQLNADTTASNYRYVQMGVYNTGLGSNGGADGSKIGSLAANSSAANSAGAGWAHIIQYTGTTFNKQIRSHWQMRADASGVHEAAYETGIEWENTNAITQIVLVITGNYVSGTTFRLYGEY